MSREEILDKYYLLIETQEEFDKVLEIFEKWKGAFNSQTYSHFRTNTYLFKYNNYFLLGNYEKSDNKKPFITYDKLLELLEEDNRNILEELTNVPILVTTREEWDNIIDWFIYNEVEYDFSLGDFEPGYYLVYDFIYKTLLYTDDELNMISGYEEEINYDEFIKLTNKLTTELTKDNLKAIMLKYLIRNNDVNNSYNDLLEFVNEVNNKFNLKLI